MTYYDLPVVKAAPWKGFVPAYFYAGGVAGAAAVLHAAVGDGPLARKLRWLAFGGEAVGAALLVADLGRPERFHHMLRGFRPRSPMNMGTWILSTASATSALQLVRPSGSARAIGAIAGGMLASYTGVLVGNTAVPVWRATRDVLPVLFAASGGASCASLLELVEPRSPVVRRFAIGTKMAAVAATLMTERAGGSLKQEPLWRAGKWLEIGSLAASVLRAPRVAGVLGTAAGLAMRFAIMAAGKASAADPTQAL